MRAEYKVKGRGSTRSQRVTKGKGATAIHPVGSRSRIKYRSRMKKRTMLVDRRRSCAKQGAIVKAKATKYGKKLKHQSFICAAKATRKKSTAKRKPLTRAQKDARNQYARDRRALKKIAAS